MVNHENTLGHLIGDDPRLKPSGGEGVNSASEGWLASTVHLLLGKDFDDLLGNGNSIDGMTFNFLLERCDRYPPFLLHSFRGLCTSPDFRVSQ